MRPIDEIADKIGLEKNDLRCYGRYMAKIPLEVLKRLDDAPDGKLVLVTAITATKAGEGKTVTSIGLMEALGALGVRTVGALRQPSMGPVFGVKGGATGGGYAQIYPMWDIDLHFTGDIHAVTSAHNLLSAMLENHLSKGNSLDIDPTRIVLKKTIDINCRELRHIIVGLDGRNDGGVPHESGFMITAASEISAILALATSLDDLKQRLGRMVVAYDMKGRPITASQLECVGAMALLLKNAIEPNLVQTLEGQPVLVHGFPFANIAHGCNSIIATKYALKMADVVVTEGGFASDLGAEKFFDIVCRGNGLRPDCAVLVASIRALKMHGGATIEDLGRPELALGHLEKGFSNLDKHIENVSKFGVPVIVALNQFPTDTEMEVRSVKDHCSELGVPCSMSRVFNEGGKGGKELAGTVLEVLRTKKSDFRPLYGTDLPIKEKIRTIATEIYGAKDVQYSGSSENDILTIQRTGNDALPVCMAKTQHSLSDDPRLKGAPTGWTLTVKEVTVSAGAGFIVVICGDIMLIPGLPSAPAAERMDISGDGVITGLS